MKYLLKQNIVIPAYSVLESAAQCKYKIKGVNGFVPCVEYVVPLGKDSICSLIIMVDAIKDAPENMFEKIE